MPGPLPPPDRARHAGGGRRSATRPRHRGVAVVAGATVAAVAVGGGLALAVAGDDEPSCARRTTLAVTTTPEVVGVVSDVAAVLARGDECATITVSAAASADVAARVAAGAGGPDVWVPDSSVWSPSSSGAATPDPAAPLAFSPVVLAVDETTATSLGWPDRSVDAAAVLAATDPTAVSLQLPDPDTDAAGTLAVAGLGALADRVPQVDLMLAQTLGSAKAATGDATVTVTTEHVVGAPSDAGDTGTDSGSATVAAYLPDAALDYPYLVLTDDPGRSALAQRLGAALRGQVAQQALRDAGLRDATGRAGAALLDAERVAADRPAGAAPPPEALATARSTVDVLRRPSRMLAVLDVSGSMAAEVPGSDGSRMDLARDAAARGLAMLPPAAVVGLWEFSTDLTGGDDHREALPLGPLTDGHRDAAVSALESLRPVEGGGTGLYDTTLAAVREVSVGWDVSRVNSVVVVSDGRDEDRDSVGLTDLLATLRAERDLDRPVPVNTIAYGPDSDAAALAAIAAVTGGAFYSAPDPRGIDRVFLDAVSQRTCRPLC